jgi:hypothetical protein
MAELVEIPDHIRSKIRIEPVRTMEEVLPLALSRPLPKPPRSKGTSGSHRKQTNGRTKTHHATAAGRGTA